MRKAAAFLLRCFLQGLLVLAPVAITFYILYYGFNKLDTLIPEMPTGVGFLTIIFGVAIIGYLADKVIVGQYVFGFFDKMLKKTPFIKYIYTSIKDVINSFVGDNRKFNKPVWLKTSNDPEEWRIGFLTQKDMTAFGLVDKVAVYLPHSYAISGWVVIADYKNIKPITNLTSAEAMKFAVSGGVTITDDSAK